MRHHKSLKLVKIKQNNQLGPFSKQIPMPGRSKCQGQKDYGGQNACWEWNYFWTKLLFGKNISKSNSHVKFQFIKRNINNINN